MKPTSRNLICCAVFLLPIISHAAGIAGKWKCGSDRVYEFTGSGKFKVFLGKTAPVIAEGNFEVSGTTIKWIPRNKPAYQPTSFTGPIDGRLELGGYQCDRLLGTK